MANPLSDRGWSDRDYAAAIGTLVGEAAVKGGLQDFQAIADVIANRQQAGVYGRSISGITMDPSQFSTWSPKEKSAYSNAKAGFAAALNPQRAASFSPAMRDRVEMAKQAVDDVFVNGKARGLTQGATAYHNPAVTAKLGTGGWHKGLEDDYGYVDIGAHRFTGKGFNPDQTFDPITYNGQLAAPPSVDPFLGDIGVPIGQVTALGPVPDLTPQQPASAGSFFGGYDLADITLPADAYTDIGYGMQDFETEQALADMRMSAYDRGFYGQQPVDDMPDIMSQFDQGTYPDITAGIFGNPLEGFAPIDTAPVDFSGVRQGMTEQQAIDAWGLGNQRPSENVEIRPGTPGFGEDVDMASRYRDDLNSTYDVQAGLYSHELSGFGTQYDGTPPAAAMATRNYGYDDPWSSPAVDFSDITAGILHDDPVAPTSSPGFAAGFDEGPWGATGDFNAPSLAARNNMDRFEGAMAVRNQSAPTNEAIASNVMAELAPQAPALAAPSFSAPPSTPATPAQPATQSFDPQAMALGDMEDKIGMQRDFSTPALAAPSLPSTPAPSTPTVAQGDVPEISARVSPKAASTRAVSTPSLAPARAAPVSARAVSAPVAAPVAAFAPAPVAQPSLFGTIASLFGSGPSGYQGSGLIGDTYSNDRGFRDPGGWSLGNLDRDFAASLMDGSAYGQYGPQPGGWFGGLFGEGGLFGGGAGAGGTRGDGSYSDSAGYNDNNPQGIL